MGVFLPQRNSDTYILETLAKRRTYTCERHQHKKTTFDRTTLNSIKAQSHSSHHFRKRENYHFLGFSVQLSTPCYQHSTYRSLGLSLCSSSPFPSPHLLCYSPGKTERTRCSYRRRENGQYMASVVLTFPLLRDCTSSFPAQVTWRVFKNRCSEI